jgi:hypothetical protein
MMEAGTNRRAAAERAGAAHHGGAVHRFGRFDKADAFVGSTKAAA